MNQNAVLLNLNTIHNVFCFLLKKKKKNPLDLKLRKFNKGNELLGMEEAEKEKKNQYIAILFFFFMSSILMPVPIYCLKPVRV